MDNASIRTEIAIAKEREMNPKDHLEIDEGILDFLVYKAIHSLLRLFQKSLRNDNWDIGTRTPEIDIQLDLVDSFLKIYRASHPPDHGHPLLQFRIRLLRFATLFTIRWSRPRPNNPNPAFGGGSRQGVDSHTKSSSMRADSGVHSISSSGSPRLIKQRHMQPPKRWEAQPTATSSLPSVSLLGTLPSFMALSAAANAMQESKITDTWMRLAAGYMAQAVLEQYMVFQHEDERILLDAFRWGFDADTPVKEGTDEWNVNAMFLDEDEEFASWKIIKEEHMQALVPQDGGNSHLHFQLLQENEFSFPTFNYTILQFLKGLSQSLPKPIIISVPSTRAGLSPERPHN